VETPLSELELMEAKKKEQGAIGPKRMTTKIEDGGKKVSFRNEADDAEGTCAKTTKIEDGGEEVSFRNEDAEDTCASPQHVEGRSTSSTSSSRPLSVSDATTEVISALSTADERYVSQVSMVYVITFFLGALPYTCTQLILASTGRSIWADAAYLSAQASYASMTISTFLRPRNEGNRRLLMAQAFLCLVVPDVVQLAAIETSAATWIR
jgi:hypothetical protein